MDARRRDPDWRGDPVPPHITVIGSNGVGAFSAGQDLTRVRATIERIAAATSPLTVELGAVERFPNSDVFAFRLVDDRGVRELHGRIVDSGLDLEPSPWPFEPHVTVWPRPTTGDAATIADAKVSGTFVLDSIAIYREATSRSAQRTFQLLFRAQLGPPPNGAR